MPSGEQSITRGRMNVLKFQEKSAINGALTLDRAPARNVTVYEAFSDRLPVGVMVIVLPSGDHEVVHLKDGEKTRELLTDVLFIDTLNEITIRELRGISCPLGKNDVINGWIKVLKFHEKSAINGALTLDRVPARSVTPYVVFSDRLPTGVMVTVLLSGDQDVVQENVGEIIRELLTDILFIDTLNEIMMVVLTGISCPIGEWDVTTGMI